VVVHTAEDFQNPYSKFFKESNDLAVLLSEKTYYAEASLAPSWIEPNLREANAKQNRSAVFPGTDGKRKFLEFAEFEPGLFTRVSTDKRPNPGFNGEIKSAGTGRVMFDEVASYVLFSIIDSYFTNNQEESCRIFYENVPIGFGLMGMAGVGYLVCMEVIGKAFVTPCSQPFFIGSNEHKQTIKDLSKWADQAKDTRVLNCSHQVFAKCSKLGEKSVVTKTKLPGDDKFWKVIRYDAFPADYFRRLHKVYSKYMNLDDSELKENNLLPAELLYGELEVAICTDFLEGYRTGTDLDMKNPDTMGQVATAIAFLARNGMLYTDLRPENFMVCNKKGKEKVMLIDYDDVEIIEKGVESLSEFQGLFKTLKIPKENNYMDKGNAFFTQFRDSLGSLFSAL